MKRKITITMKSSRRLTTFCLTGALALGASGGALAAGNDAALQALFAQANYWHEKSHDELAMESLQTYLPSRVPSNVDLLLNTLGGCLGACFAWVLERTGLIDRWSRLRARWFAPDARGALVLLLLWPIALLFPAAVPLGLGQVFERLESALADVLADTPFLEWMPVREIELQPLVPLAEVVCVALGALIPCLLGYCVIRTLWQRATFSVVVVVVGLVMSALSAALSYGPDHAWAWLDAPVQVGVVLAAVLAGLFLALPRRVAAATTLLALSIHLGLLNQAPPDPYFAQTLQIWEQGRFIHFYGVVFIGYFSIYRFNFTFSCKYLFIIN